MRGSGRSRKISLLHLRRGVEGRSQSVSPRFSNLLRRFHALKSEWRRINGLNVFDSTRDFFFYFIVDTFSCRERRKSYESNEFMTKIHNCLRRAKVVCIGDDICCCGDVEEISISDWMDSVIVTVELITFSFVLVEFPFPCTILSSLHVNKVTSVKRHVRVWIRK